MPSKQEITSVYISSSNNNLYLQWTLSQIPMADEFFRIKLTIQAEDDSVEVTEVILSCNTTCLTDQRVIYQLTGIVSNSLYLADITVINQYGNYSRMYQFFPQSILTSQGFSQYTEVTGIIITLVIIIVLLLLFIIILIIALCIICVRCHSKTDSQKLPQKLTNSDHIELFPNQLASQPYYNMVSDNITSMQTEEILEPTYARIDDDGKVLEERDVLNEVDSTLIGEEKRDLDYENMKSADCTLIGEGISDLDYENMKSVDSTLVVAHTNVSCMLYVRMHVYTSGHKE